MGQCCSHGTCINFECCETCSDHPDYYSDRYSYCMTNIGETSSYCAGWMGCAGAIAVDGYGTVTGTCGEL
jgi:hypothetical protein